MTGKNRVIKVLRNVVTKVITELNLPKDLWREMSVHLVRLDTGRPGHPTGWSAPRWVFPIHKIVQYGCGGDIQKSAKKFTVWEHLSENFDGHVGCLVDAVEPLGGQGELVAKGIINQMSVPMAGRLFDEVMPLRAVTEPFA